MGEDDIEWLAERLEDSSWLFYGEFEEYLNLFLKEIFSKELRDIGFDEAQRNDFQVAYWSVLSELVSLDFAEYGTSPRGAWLTPDGERFKRIVLELTDAIPRAAKFTHLKYNPEDRDHDGPATDD